MRVGCRPEAKQQKKVQMPVLIDKVVHLSEERIKRLGQLASASGTTEEALIEKAIDILLELSREESGLEHRAWSAASLPALQRVWDNDADAVYDNWRELYGVPQG